MAEREENPTIPRQPWKRLPPLPDLNQEYPQETWDRWFDEDLQEVDEYEKERKIPPWIQEQIRPE